MADRDEPTLDTARFEALRAAFGAGPGDVVDEILGLFLHDVPVRLATLHAAVRAGALDAAAATAHGLRGCCGTFGALRMASTARELEDAARLGRGTEALLGLVEELEDEFRRVSARVTGQLVGAAGWRDAAGVRA